jgi:hypothetical protein
VSGEFNIPELPEPDVTEVFGDQKAQQEVEHWDDYERISRQRNSNTLLVHKTIGWCVPVAIILAVGLFFLAVGIYVYHILSPVGWRWLPAAELDHLHNMIFSGVVGGAVATAARVYLVKD